MTYHTIIHKQPSQLRQLPDHEPGLRTGQPVSNPPSNPTTRTPPLPELCTIHSPHAAGVGLVALPVVELGDGNSAGQLLVSTVATTPPGKCRALGASRLGPPLSAPQSNIT